MEQNTNTVEVVPARIAQLLEGIKRDGHAVVRYHPEDPYARHIETYAQVLGLEPVADPKATYRSITGEMTRMAQPAPTLAGAKNPDTVPPELVRAIEDLIEQVSTTWAVAVRAGLRAAYEKGRKDERESA